LSARNAASRGLKFCFGVFMGKVALTLKVMPESPDVDLDELKNRIKSLKNLQQISEKPIGFGLVCLEVLFVFEDKEGIGDIEEKLRSIDGVGSVESGDVTLI